LITKHNTPEKLEQVKELLRGSRLELGSSSAKTCLMLLCKQGDSFVEARDYIQACEFYKLACNLFSSNLVDSRNQAILQRKIAFCYISLESYETAREACVKAVGLDTRANELNFYLLYVIHVHLKDIEQGIYF
jgi:tetratricopeptide (TPR) repeat protein